MSILNFFKGKQKTRQAKNGSVVINDELGTFTLERFGKESYIFKGEINMLGEEVIVTLHSDTDNSLTANTALENLRKIVADADNWNKFLKEYIADDMSEEDGTIEIWGDGNNFDEPSDDILTVTREEFINRISIGFIQLYPNDEVYFDYDLDEMFTDHGMGITVNMSKEVSSCGLVG